MSCQWHLSRLTQQHAADGCTMLLDMIHTRSVALHESNVCHAEKTDPQTATAAALGQTESNSSNTLVHPSSRQEENCRPHQNMPTLDSPSARSTCYQHPTRQADRSLQVMIGRGHINTAAQNVLRLGWDTWRRACVVRCGLPRCKPQTMVLKSWWV